MTEKRPATLLTALALVVAILAIAIWVRVPAISTRPMHPDEAVQGMRTLLLLETGEFEYDPTDLHGPLLYYLSAAVASLFGRVTPSDINEQILRSVPLVAGLFVVLLPLLFTGMGIAGRLAACALLATCSAMAFYSTMYFHEMLHVLLCWSFILLFWRWLLHASKSSWVLLPLSGLSLGLAIATKESWILIIAAWAISLSVYAWLQPQALARWRTGLTKRVMIAFIVLLLLPPLLLFTNFLQSPGEIAKPFAAMFHYLEKVDGVTPAGNHRHPVTFFLSRLIWFHAAPGPVWFLATPLVLGLAGFAIAIRRFAAGHQEAAPIISIAAIALLLLVFHLLVPYKTPWLLLLPIFALCLVGGYAIEAVWNQTSTRPTLRVMLALLMITGTLLLSLQAHKTTGQFGNDPRNPWVYAAAADDVLSLSDRIHEAQECVPDSLRIDVWAVDYWPLPWYLRDIPGTGYWTTIPNVDPAPLVILNLEQEPGLAALLLERGYERQYFGLRNEVSVALYIDPVLLSCLRQRWAGNTVAP